MTAQELCTAVMLLAFLLGACIGGVLGWYLATPRRQQPETLMGPGDLAAAKHRRR